MKKNDKTKDMKKMIWLVYRVRPTRVFDGSHLNDKRFNRVSGFGLSAYTKILSEFVRQIGLSVKLAKLTESVRQI